MRPVIRYRSQLLYRKSHKIDRNIRIRVRPRADKGVAFQALCPRNTARVFTTTE
jgi:hypothetical protein